MKIHIQPVLTALLAMLLHEQPAFAQNYSLDWHKISGGGGTGAGGNYQLSGTIGQHDASGAMTAGNYSLTGGFWTIIAAVPTPGVPNLLIQCPGPSSVKISWPNTGNYTLQQNGDLSTQNWNPSGYAVTMANGTNSITITPPAGNLFFRLAQP